VNKCDRCGGNYIFVPAYDPWSAYWLCIECDSTKCVEGE
jgi:hypothetical protein